MKIELEKKYVIWFIVEYIFRTYIDDDKLNPLAIRRVIKQNLIDGSIPWANGRKMPDYYKELKPRANKIYNRFFKGD